MLSALITFALGAFLFMILLLNIVSVPANWIIFSFFLIMFFIPSSSIVLTNIGILFLIAICAEILEAIVQLGVAKKSGASTAGNWGGILGSIIGAIFGIPFFLGIGALIGALLGAWLGCYAVERMRGNSNMHASKAAIGALKGKFLGFTIKIALGAYMIIYGLGVMDFSTIDVQNTVMEKMQQEETLIEPPLQYEL